MTRDTELILVALGRIGAALEGIWEAIDKLTPAPVPPDAPCEHPQELRVADFGMTAGMADWQCACGYRSVQETH